MDGEMRERVRLRWKARAPPGRHRCSSSPPTHIGGSEDGPAPSPCALRCTTSPSPPSFLSQQNLHGDVNVRQRVDGFCRVQRVLHQLPHGGVQAFAGLGGGWCVCVWVCVGWGGVGWGGGLCERDGGSACADGRIKKKRRTLDSPHRPPPSSLAPFYLTLSKPAMFLFSAKNSAGDFCCRSPFFLGGMVFTVKRREKKRSFGSATQTRVRLFFSLSRATP